MKTLAFSWIVIAALGMVGCSNPLGGDASSVESGHLPGVANGSTPTLPPARGAEFVATSQQQVLTTHGKYKVEAALGSATQSIESKTTQGNELYSNVQGQILTN